MNVNKPTLKALESNTYFFYFTLKWDGMQCDLSFYFHATDENENENITRHVLNLHLMRNIIEI